MTDSTTPANTPTRRQRLATFNACHSHEVFSIARAFVDRLAPAFPGIRPMVALGCKTDRFDFACVVSEFCRNLNDLSAMSPVIEAVGERLAARGFTPAHIPIARAAFMHALRECAGHEWSAQIEQDWSAVVGEFFGCMKFGEARTMRMAA